MFINAGNLHKILHDYIILVKQMLYLICFSYVFIWLQNAKFEGSLSKSICFSEPIPPSFYLGENWGQRNSLLPNDPISVKLYKKTQDTCILRTSYLVFMKLYQLYRWYNMKNIHLYIAHYLELAELEVKGIVYQKTKSAQDFDTNCMFRISSNRFQIW